MHWAEGTRKESMALGFVDDKLGRNVRESGVAAIAIVALPCGSYRCNASAAAVGRSMDGSRFTGASEELVIARPCID